MGGVSALIFDFDGLILDTEVPEYESWCEIYREHGAVLPLSEWVKCIGTSADAFDPLAYLEGQIGRPVNREAVRARHRALDSARVATEPLMPGVRDYAGRAQSMGLKLAVASSSSHRGIDRHLAERSLAGYFECVMCREDAAHAKPAPDLYLAALECLGVSSGEAVAFEDSPNGVAAAKAAGITCVAVPNAMTAHLGFDHADLVIESLAAVPLDRLLAKLERAG